MALTGRLEDLVVFGGLPAFSKPLHVGCPNVGQRDRFLERVNDLLDRRRLSNDGPFVREFEQRIADLVGVRHCIAVCNATLGLEIAARAVELTGEVVVPSMTFPATPHALQWQGITPVFCDVGRRSHNLDPDRVEAAITARTSGILAVHLWGRPCDTEALSEVARRHHLKLLFDAAHAFGCSQSGKMIGSFGEAEVFSFHATKFVNAIEGGAIVTNDDHLAYRSRLMRDFGFDQDGNVLCVGVNAKMTEMSAAMGLTSLESMDSIVAANHANYSSYRCQLEGIPGLWLVLYDESQVCNFQYTVIEVDDAIAGISRDQLLHVLAAENVLARRYFWPGCHRLEPYRSGLELPETDRLLSRILCLPTGTAVASDAIATICQTIRMVVAQSGELGERLSRLTPGRG